MSESESNNELPESAGEAAGSKTDLDELKRAARNGELPIVAKTALDLDACRQVAYTMASNAEEKIGEMKVTAAPAPAKPFVPINDYKKAMTCDSTWDDMQGTGAIRFCNRCRLNVYDFHKKDLKEAEEMIFQKEGKRDFTLYKRGDDKFLIANCPVAMKKQRIIGAGVACLVLVVLGIFYVLSALPPPPAQIDQAINKAFSQDSLQKPAENTKAGELSPAKQPVRRRHSAFDGP
jgi:hypothetical protein